MARSKAYKPYLIKNPSWAIHAPKDAITFQTDTSVKRNIHELYLLTWQGRQGGYQRNQEIYLDWSKACDRAAELRAALPKRCSITLRTLAD